MKRWFLCAVLLLVNLGASAQEDTGYVAILPGYQFPSGSETQTFAPLSVRAAQRDHWLASLDFGWFFTDRIGLHAGYIYMPTEYELHLWSGTTDLGTRTISQSANILEIGPEFYWDIPWEWGQVYAQLNAGRPFGSSGASSSYGGPSYTSKSGDAWSLGGTLGYRYPFNDTVGWTVQGTFHYVNNWPSNKLWDVRTGVAFRFPRGGAPAPPPARPTPRPTPPPSPPPPPTPRPTPPPTPPPPPARTPRPTPPPPAVQPPPKTINITLDERVLHFATDGWAIPKDAAATLDAVVRKLKEVPLQVRISGHTDNTGTAAWNATVSKHRAEAVKKYLVDHGVAAGRIVSATGEGPSRPVADNKTAEGRSRNRRVEITSVAPVAVPAR